MNLDIESLRYDLFNYYGAFTSIYEPAFILLDKIKTASDEEIIKLALENNFDLDKYKVEEKSK